MTTTHKTLATLGTTLVRFVTLAALAATTAYAQTKYWVGDGITNTWHTSAIPQAWSTSNPPQGGPQPAPSTSYADGNTIVFDRDVLTNTTITVQAAGVTPGSLQIDTGVNWTFRPETAAGGKINAFLNHADTSGGGTSLTFNYDTSPGFTGADIRAGICNWVLSSSAVAGNYTFLTGGAGDIELANGIGGAPGFHMNVAAAATGNYVVTDNFVVADVPNGGVLNATVASGRTVTYAGDIDLQQKLSSNVHSVAFTGTVTFTENRVIDCQSGSEGVTLDFSGATLAGGGSSDLTLQTGNGNYRGYKLPDAGTRLNIRKPQCHPGLSDDRCGHPL